MLQKNATVCPCGTHLSTARSSTLERFIITHIKLFQWCHPKNNNSEIRRLRLDLKYNSCVLKSFTKKKVK